MLSVSAAADGVCRAVALPFKGPYSHQRAESQLRWAAAFTVKSGGGELMKILMVTLDLNLKCRRSSLRKVLQLLLYFVAWKNMDKINLLY